MNYINCIDASTDYCPCILAEANECLICSQLRGEKFCDCRNYSGTCIYQEFVWNKNQSKQTREYKVYPIIEKTHMRDDILLMKIKLNSTLCRELNNIGAFVFLRSPRNHESLSLPVSIVSSDVQNELITLIIKKVGVKSKKIFECEEQILVKGPYFNGIQGQSNIKTIRNENCLIIGRGVALAPAVMTARKLIERNNRIFAIIHSGRGDKSYLSEFFEALNCDVKNTELIDEEDNLTEGGLYFIKQCLEDNKITTVISAGNDIFHNKAISLLNKLDDTLKFASVNNSIMCCGEGNCGSCIIKISGKEIKTCKEQYNPLNVFGGGELNL